MTLYVISLVRPDLHHMTIRIVSVLFTVHPLMCSLSPAELLPHITTIHTHRDPHTLAYHMYYLLSCLFSAGQQRVSTDNGLV